MAKSDAVFGADADKEDMTFTMLGIEPKHTTRAITATTTAYRDLSPSHPDGAVRVFTARHALAVGW